jgi:hypothetical protein
MAKAQSALKNKTHSVDRSATKMDTATRNIESRPVNGKSIFPYQAHDPNRNRKYVDSGNIGHEIEYDVWRNDVNKGQVGSDKMPRKFGKLAKKKPS